MIEFLFRLRGAESCVLVKAPDICLAILIAKRQLGSYFYDVVEITNANWKEVKDGSPKV